MDFNLDLRGEIIPERQVYFFSGNSVPKNFSLDGTDSAWLYFSTDKSVENAGFQVIWTSAGEHFLIGKIIFSIVSKVFVSRSYCTILIKRSSSKIV